MKIYIEIVSCIGCPYRIPMRECQNDPWSEEYDNRYICTNKENDMDGKHREILLHPSLDAPDWCKLPNVKEPDKNQERTPIEQKNTNIKRTAARYPNCMGNIDPYSGECRMCKFWEICLLISEPPELLKGD